MKLIQLLTEIISPQKPNKVRAYTHKQAGVQGSEVISQRRDFTTTKGNKVTVKFSPKNEYRMKGVDVSFYVNDTMNDDASTTGKGIDNDFEILSGVIFLILQYVKRAKIERISFLAYNGTNDTKLMHNVPVDKYISSIKTAMDKFKNDLINFELTPEKQAAHDRKIQVFKSRFNMDVSNEYMHKDELLKLISDLDNYLSNNKDYKQYEGALESFMNSLHRFMRNVNQWDSYLNFEKSLYDSIKALSTHREGGAYITKNRRAEIYSKLLGKYFPSGWDIKRTGSDFIITKQ